jgi:hypothetical protein
MLEPARATARSAGAVRGLKRQVMSGDETLVTGPKPVVVPPYFQNMRLAFHLGSLSLRGS